MTNQHHDDPASGVDWDSFGFGLNGVQTDFMWLDRVPVDGKGEVVYASGDDCAALQPLGMIPLSPAATVLNYGQALFEGLKAHRQIFQYHSLGLQFLLFLHKLHMFRVGIFHRSF